MNRTPKTTFPKSVRNHSGIIFKSFPHHFDNIVICFFYDLFGEGGAIHFFFEAVSACDSPPMSQLLWLRGVPHKSPSDVWEKAPMNHARKHKHIVIKTLIPKYVARGLYFSSAHFPTKLVTGHSVGLGGY